MTKTFALFTLLFLPLITTAQEYFNAYTVPNYALNASANRYTWLTTKDTLFKNASPKGKDVHENVPSKSTVFVPSLKRGAGIDKLSARAPAVQRQQVKRAYDDALTGYQKIEAQFAIPKNDVAGALAAFLVGHYMAYRQIDFPDERFKPVVNQMRKALAGNEAFRRTSNADKQEMYEQMASVGMLMATSQIALKQTPNPQMAANLRQAAKTQLEQFLSIDVEKLQISAQGLTLK